jgi:hypothetical protein
MGWDWDWDDGFWLEVGLSGGLLGTNRRWLISCLTFGGPLGTLFWLGLTPSLRILNIFCTKIL